MVQENAGIPMPTLGVDLDGTILGGCQTVIDGLGAICNGHRDADGTKGAGVRPAPRHAELAVNLAGTMATFLLATWEAKQK